MNNSIVIIIILFFLSFTSCKKLVEVDSPSTSISSKSAFNNDATAVGSVSSLYANLWSGFLFGATELSSLSSIAGLSADELSYFTPAGQEILEGYYQNSLTNSISFNGYWTTTYQRLYLVNIALEELQNSNKLSPGVRQQLLGEARFMRAFYYFYLINLYGEVPLVLGTDYATNSLIAKSSKEQIYQQIISDLNEAQNLLSDKYIKGDGHSVYENGAEERVRPTKWAAIALLSRTYLYLNDWSNAEAQANLILENITQFQLQSLDGVFLKNNGEAIWQLQPVQMEINTQDAEGFILREDGPSSERPVYLSDDLLASFEIEDQRKSVWTGSVMANSNTYYYPAKYKVTYPSASVTEYSTVIRLAELYLIRAEARARQDNLSGAISDIDKIRNRAGLALIEDINPAIGKDDLIELILKEKKLEFFAEWGHRWLDLKRTGLIDEVMTVATPKKGNSSGWKTYQQYYPISLSELRANPNLSPTPGY